MNALRRVTSTRAPASVMLGRIMAGTVFLSEGIQKFLFAAEAGTGRFAKIGLPNPEFPGPFVGGFEIVCGALVLLGLISFDGPVAHLGHLSREFVPKCSDARHR